MEELNEILITALGCLSRRMPDGSIEITKEEVEELETDLEYYGVKVNLKNKGIHIVPIEYDEVFFLKHNDSVPKEPKKSFLKRLLKLE